MRKFYMGLRILLAVVALFAVAKRASAQDVYSTANQNTAYQSCLNHYSGSYSRWDGCHEIGPGHNGTNHTQYGWQATYATGNGTEMISTWHYAEPSCGSQGLAWNTTTRVCYNPNAACDSVKAAQADPNSPNYNNPNETSTRTQPSSCIGGCTWACIGVCDSAMIMGVASGTTGHFGFTGAACPVTPESPTPAAVPLRTSQSVCTPGPNGQSFCKRQDGKYCYSASTGREICWTPLETGVKTDRNVAQVRCAGSSPCPAPTPPAGETLAPSGTPTTVSNSTTNTTVSNTSTSTTTTTSTSTTTVNNNTTGFGTSAGSSDQGQASGAAAEAAPEGDAGSITGGENCATPMIISGGDPVANKTLLEIHDAECAKKAAAAADMETLGVENSKGDPSDDGQTDSERKASLWHSGSAPATRYGSGGVIASLFGTAADCPTLPPVDMGGTVFALPPEFCAWGAWIRWLFITIAYIWALRIVTS